MKNIRDRIVPLLVERAHLEMTRLYKPGMVESLGDAIVGFLIASKPIRSIIGAIGSTDFYAKYDVTIPLKPLVPISLDAHEILQGDIRAKIGSTNIKPGEDLKKEGTLLIFWTTYWVTREGHVWHEDDENIWRPVMQLPEGLLKSSFIDMRATLHQKYHV